MRIRPDRWLGTRTTGAFLLTTASLLLAGCVSAGSPSQSSRSPLLDHHSHVQSNLVIQAIGRGCRAMPEICPPTMPTPKSGQHMLAEMDEAGISQSLVISTAYLLAAPLTAADGLNVPELVRAENNYAARQAALAPERLLLVIAVAPLHESAEAELDHWLARPEVAAVKIHLTPSGFSFRNPDHVARLAWLFARVAEAQKGIVIHMRTPERDYGASDIEIFLNQVVPAARGQPIQIAHAGSWGGFDQRTSEIVDTFAAAAASGELPSNIWFDISSIAFPNVPAAHLEAATPKLRALGVSRLVFGSDSGWDMTPARAWVLMRESLSFTDSEWEIIRTNRTPFQSRAR